MPGTGSGLTGRSLRATPNPRKCLPVEIGDEEMTEWIDWEPGTTPVPTFRVRDRVEVILSNGDRETGIPHVFHWWPESAKGGPIVKSWRKVATPANP